MVNTAFAHEFTTPCKLVCKCGIYHAFGFLLVCTFSHLICPEQGGGEGRCLQGNLWYSPTASMTSRLTSVTFKMASKVFIEETDKNFDFITEILFRFFGFGDFKVSLS